MTWWSLTDLLIARWILIALRRFWYCLKGLLKGFWWPFRLSKLVKYFWSYGLNEVCDTTALLTTALILWLYYHPKERISNLNTFLRMWCYSSTYTAHNKTSAQDLSSKKSTSKLLSTIQLQDQVSDTIPELSTVFSLIVPNWLPSPLKPRVWLCMEVTSDCDNYQLRVKKAIRVKMSKVQGR